jgi:antitoxin component of MazEF toxin-antitoxin module
MKQKIVKLSGDRLGMYFNKHVVNSLDMKKGEDIYISVPDKKHIVIEVGE